MIKDWQPIARMFAHDLYEVHRELRRLRAELRSQQAILDPMVKRTFKLTNSEKRLRRLTAEMKRGLLRKPG